MTIRVRSSQASASRSRSSRPLTRSARGAFRRRGWPGSSTDRRSTGNSSASVTTLSPVAPIEPFGHQADAGRRVADERDLVRLRADHLGGRRPASLRRPSPNRPRPGCRFRPPPSAISETRRPSAAAAATWPRDRNKPTALRPASRPAICAAFRRPMDMRFPNVGWRGDRRMRLRF